MSVTIASPPRPGASLAGRRVAPVVAAILAGACGGDADLVASGAPPVSPPPRTSSAAASLDAAPDDGLARRTVRGWVCEVQDLARPSSCQTVTAAELVVTVGDGAQAPVALDGTFEIAVPVGPAVLTVPPTTTWTGGVARVAGDEAETVVRLVGAETLQAVVTASAISHAPGAGVLVVQVTQRGAPVENAVLSPVEGVSPAYATDDPLVYTAGGATGPNGAAAYFGLPPGAVAFLVSAGTLAAGGDATIAAGAVSFETAELGPAP